MYVGFVWCQVYCYHLFNSGSTLFTSTGTIPVEYKTVLLVVNYVAKVP